MYLGWNLTKNKAQDLLSMHALDYKYLGVRSWGYFAMGLNIIESLLIPTLCLIILYWTKKIARLVRGIKWAAYLSQIILERFEINLIANKFLYHDWQLWQNFSQNDLWFVQLKNMMLQKMMYITLLNVFFIRARELVI